MKWVYLAILLLFNNSNGYTQSRENFVGIYPGENLIEKYAREMYYSLKCKNLNYDIFKKGLKGYLYLKSADMLGNQNILTLVDYSMPVFERRGTTEAQQRIPPL